MKRRNGDIFTVIKAFNWFKGPDVELFHLSKASIIFVADTGAHQQSELNMHALSELLELNENVGPVITSSPLPGRTRLIDLINQLDSDDVIRLVHASKKAFFRRYSRRGHFQLKPKEALLPDDES
ncbi:unnamed protein product [Protopolystoma xenopodis]|uniref:Uncharacterized protein n=1 Tax=Protopolystoma xenopodis TaxID=117903 RepID=A0A3S5ASL2_9PLAT|nr:unnamed protein product [Protopolystoma xenopodis]